MNSINNRLWNQAMNRLVDQLDSQVLLDQVWHEVSNQLYWHVGDQVWKQVDDQP